MRPSVATGTRGPWQSRVARKFTSVATSGSMYDRWYWCEAYGFQIRPTGSGWGSGKGDCRVHNYGHEAGNPEDALLASDHSEHGGAAKPTDVYLCSQNQVEPRGFRNRLNDIYGC